MERHEEIQQLAYRYWEQEGCRDGQALDYWLRAENEWGHQTEPVPAASVAVQEKPAIPAPARRSRRKAKGA